MIRHNNIMTNKLTNGRARRVRKTVTYIDNLKEDSGLANINEMRTMMFDRDGARARNKYTMKLSIATHFQRKFT